MDTQEQNRFKHECFARWVIKTYDRWDLRDAFYQRYALRHGDAALAQLQAAIKPLEQATPTKITPLTPKQKPLQRSCLRDSTYWIPSTQHPKTNAS